MYSPEVNSVPTEACVVQSEILLGWNGECGHSLKCLENGVVDKVGRETVDVVCLQNLDSFILCYLLQHLVCKGRLVCLSSSVPTLPTATISQFTSCPIKQLRSLEPVTLCHTMLLHSCCRQQLIVWWFAFLVVHVLSSVNQSCTLNQNPVPLLCVMSPLPQPCPGLPSPLPNSTCSGQLPFHIPEWHIPLLSYSVSFRSLHFCYFSGTQNSTLGAPLLLSLPY